jgi:opacity protein-like surface antigen
VGAAFQVSYADLDYPDAVASGLRTESDVMKAGVQLVYSIDENWTADLYYNYLEVDSDTAIYDGERNDVGMGLRYDF